MTARPTLTRQDGSICRSGALKQAHRDYRYLQTKDWAADWTFERCLKYAWAQARGRKDLDRFKAVERAMKRLTGDK